MMRAAWIEPYDSGPHIDKLRNHFAKQIEGGMKARHWSFGPRYGELTPDERAAAILNGDGIGTGPKASLIDAIASAKERFPEVFGG